MKDISVKEFIFGKFAKLTHLLKKGKTVGDIGDISVKKNITPEEYFHFLKENKNTISDEELQAVYDNCMVKAIKYSKTKQNKGLAKLIFLMKCVEKEKKIISFGINTFIYKEDVEDYIYSVSDKAVKIIELKNYVREIPDELVTIIEKTSSSFSKFYILFTDYTGKEERKIKANKRATDPILFGSFQDIKTGTSNDRLYYLGDWEDEFCNLTLERMVCEVKNKENRDITRKISTPLTVEELESQLNNLEETSNGEFRLVNRQLTNEL